MEAKVVSWSWLRSKLPGLWAAAAVVLVMQVGEDMAKGVPAPGNLTPLSVFWGVVRFGLVSLLINRFVVKPTAPKSTERFRGFAIVVLLLSVFFFFETWSTAKDLLLAGMAMNAVLQHAAIWLVCGIIALAAGAGLTWCAWVGSKREIERRMMESLGKGPSYDEREAEVIKRASQSALKSSLILLFLLLPLGEALLLHRYPVWSLAIGGAVALAWAAAYAYWSVKL